MSYGPKRTFGESKVVPLVILAALIAVAVGVLAYNGALENLFSPHHAAQSDE